ncbi:conserved Plasmodium protein, unknown function [Plasmodium vinckei vinckei]|uniref:Uncharacterized protein n=1 Tax=Plasmodium vinckei vinckei TaxID=54757 RepID=A0A449BYK4_PLAVN|nr:conserved Plasmodium protein, unknown function [Plasmodium vinckei vinckei]VEV58538.1 conserved Plasmodium protein, unknown function [Plasmodium vinckei vinckei]
MKDFMQIKRLGLWNGYHRKLETCKNFFVSINKIGVSENFNYSSKLANPAYKQTKPILEINKNERNKNNINRSKNGNDNYDHVIPDGNDEFYELIKKSFKEKKNDLGLWNIYCREIMYRINENNLSPKIITNSLTLLSYTEYENNRIFIEIINRCILRLKDFDLIHICSIVNFLCKRNLKSIYLLQEIQKRIINEDKIEFFDKPSSPHYISLLINSLIKLDYFDNIENKEFLIFLLQKVEKKNPSEFSLVGLSLLLYNISKLKIVEKYYLFSLYQDHILKLKNHLNAIQIINILNAYNTTNYLTFPMLIQLLDSLICENNFFKKISLHHLIRLIQTSFLFLSKHGQNLWMLEMENHIHDKQNGTNNEYQTDYKIVIQMNILLINSIFNALPFCKKKEDIILLCSTMSTHKDLVMNCFDIKKEENQPCLIIDNVNELFKIMKTNLTNFIDTCNNIELSIIFYCYSIYKINDINLFQCIKLRVLRIFSTFDEKTFSYIFKAFKNLKITDYVFEYSCLNKITQFNQFNSINNLSRILSAYIMISPEKHTPQIANIFFKSFKQILIHHFEKKQTPSIGSDNSLNSEEVSQIENGQECNNHFMDMASVVVKLFSRVTHLDIPNFIIFILNNFYIYTKNMAINNMIIVLDSLAILSSKIKIKEDKVYWKNYYCMINYYVNKILENNQLYKNKNLMINFLSATGKIYHSYIRADLDNYFIFNENNNKPNLYSQNIYFKQFSIDKQDNNELVFKNFFFFKNMLDKLLPHLKGHIKNMTIGEITVLMECLKKENYSEEATYIILKDENKNIFNDLVKRCITIFTSYEESERMEAKYYMNYKNKKNGIIILKNLILLQIYNNKLVDLIVKNYILQYNYLSSINLLSQSIYYMCVYNLWTEYFVKKKKIFLLKILMQKIYELFINNNILIHDFSNSNIHISLNQIKKFSEDISFVNSVKYLQEATLIMLLTMTTSRENNIICHQENIDINNSELFLHDINFLRLYLAVFNMADYIMEKNTNHKPELSSITIQIQNIFQNLNIKIENITLFHFYNIIKLSF